MATASASLDRARIDINRATVEALSAIEGIDRALAERIVAYRNRHGLFASVEQLADVRGVGRDLVERLRERLYAAGADPEEVPTEVPAGEEPELAAPDDAPTEGEPTGGERDVRPPRLEAPAQPAGALEEGEGSRRTIRLTGATPPVSEEPIPMGAPPSAAPEPEGSSGMTTAASAEVTPADAASEEVAAGDAFADLGTSGAAAAQAPTASREPGSLARERAIVRERIRPAERPRGRAAWWLGALIGGIVGSLLTLLLVGLLTGGFDIARRGEVAALSRNLDTVTRNTELMWARVDEMSAELGTLQTEVGTVRGSLDDVDERLGTAQADLEASIDDLSARTADQVGDLDERLRSTSATVGELGATVDDLQTTLGDVEDRVVQFGGFLEGLRELLLQLEEQP